MTANFCDLWMLAPGWMTRPLQQAAPGIDGGDFATSRLRGRVVAGRTGARAQAGDLPARANQTSVYAERPRQTQAAEHLERAGSGLHDSHEARVGADYRSRSHNGPRPSCVSGTSPKCEMP